RGARSRRAQVSPKAPEQHLRCWRSRGSPSRAPCSGLSPLTAPWGEGRRRSGVGGATPTDLSGPPPPSPPLDPVPPDRKRISTAVPRAVYVFQGQSASGPRTQDRTPRLRGSHAPPPERPP